MNIKYVVELNDKEINILKELVSTGKSSARQLKRAHILLMADTRKHQDKDISEALNVGTATIYRTKKRFVEDGLSEALNEGARPGMPRKLDANQEALLIALTCSKPPEGLCRWTLNLIADRFISLSDVEVVSTETIRRRFKENALKPWQKKMWCVGKMNADNFAQMIDNKVKLESIGSSHCPFPCSAIPSNTRFRFARMISHTSIFVESTN